MLKVEKRDGRLVDFNSDKIKIAVLKASSRLGIVVPDSLYEKIEKEVKIKTDKNGHIVPITINEIQNIVERNLSEFNTELYRIYSDYRKSRDIARYRKSSNKKFMDELSNITSTDILKENANMSGETPSGQMMKVASENSKEYSLKFLVDPKYAQLHEKGRIHIHDNDYYLTKTMTCLHYDLMKLFKGGFETEHTHIREPQRIETYAELAAIVFQTCQNEFHGGQSIPAFDFFMAPGVLKSFKKNLRDICEIYLTSIGDIWNPEIDKAIEGFKSIELSPFDLDKLITALGETEERIPIVIGLRDKAYELTEKQTYQAMESFLYNMETMHSRGGNQVVFSSINYGTDTSPEGRMVMKCLLDATEKGGGKGETFIFPIQIWKMKEGVSFSESYVKEYLRTGVILRKDCPNFDLFIKACEVSSKRLFPNFLNLDSTFNNHEKWDAEDPERWRYEVATMGCRTRVFEDVNGEKTSVGRGNMSFTTINLVGIALDILYEKGLLKNGVISIPEDMINQLKVEYMNKLDEVANDVACQLLQRCNYQETAKGVQFPFTIGNKMMIGSEELQSMAEELHRSISKHGTLGIGFIGGYEAMVALFGKGHDENKESLDFLHEIVNKLNEVANDWKVSTSRNFSILATPAEGLSGRFTKIDRSVYGKIKGVTDRDYYTNSFHVAVYKDISAQKKVDIEAPFHEKTLGGHISYIELDGAAKYNLPAFVSLVGYMKSKNMGYYSINHPIDRCKKCNFSGIINGACPKCGSVEISRVRRITGYLVGDMDKWNSYKKAEEHDRVKHQL